ncbi:MAG: CIA30 family protein [Verrucomicrobia bacterium]|nr:CIA30 family protein [Verrucomicrobiota bacterium]
MTSTLTRFTQLVGLLALTSMVGTMKAHAATNTTLFDFQAVTNAPAWIVVNDDVMGGVSTSQFQVLTNGGAVFSGTVRLENNGGFASVRSAPLRGNLTGLTAFVLRVRGDGRRYKFSVRTGAGFDTPLYQCGFMTKPGEWEEHRLAFSDFVPTFRGRVLTDVPPLNPAEINLVGFLIADQQAGPFRLEVAWINMTRPVRVSLLKFG